MFSRRRVAIDKALLAKLERYAAIAGYSSVEELITHVLEREVAPLDAAATEEEIRKRLKGLGYLS